MTKEEYAQQQNEIIGAYKRLFDTPDGKLVLGDLRAAYKDATLSGKDVVTKAAKHDVVVFIERLALEPEADATKNEEVMTDA